MSGRRVTCGWLAKGVRGGVALLALLAAGCLEIPAAAAAEEPGGPSVSGGDSDELCAAGRQQSPVDIEEARTARLPSIGFHYSRSRLRVSNDGETLRVDIDQGSFIRLGAERYELVQIRFHSPAEERMDGDAAPLGAHLIHESADGKLAVVAVEFVRGHANGTLEEILRHVPQVGQSLLRADLDFAAEDLIPADHGYYTYEGSLTTPPCTEGVRWLILREPLHASHEQMVRLAASHPDNARPAQPLNGREILESER